jgi:hypothetical protein
MSPSRSVAFPAGVMRKSGAEGVGGESMQKGGCDWLSAIQQFRNVDLVRLGWGGR